MKETIYERLHKVAGQKSKYIRETLYYSLGGYNYFSYKQESRGYYISVTPVTRESRGGVVMESYTAFTGTKICVHPVQRKSAKAAKIAEEKAAQVSAQLIAMVCAENGIQIEKENGGN